LVGVGCSEVAWGAHGLREPDSARRERAEVVVELGHGPQSLVAAHVVQRTLRARAVQVSVEAVETVALAVAAAVRGRVLVRRVRLERVVEAPVVVRAVLAGTRQARGLRSGAVAARGTDVVEVDVDCTRRARLRDPAAERECVVYWYSI
jgi:hypothetical protein